MNRRYCRVPLLAGAAALLLAVGYMVGQGVGDPLAAQTPEAKAAAPIQADKRVVAYVYGNKPITREAFGEFLIQRFGRDRVRLYVNQQIIEAEAAKRGVVVTPQEVESMIDQDCGKMGVTKSDFINVVLQQKYGKTIQEWRDDVIRPRLLLAGMVTEIVRSKMTDDELKRIYENLYGEKVACKVIMWPPDQAQTAFKRYAELRANPEEFDKEARRQPNSDLAARAGLVDPIGRNSGPGTAKIEQIAFQLKEGELSEVIHNAGAAIIVKCVKRIPPNTKVTFEQARPHLEKEYLERMTEAEVPGYFSKLRDEADPLFVLTPSDITRQELEHQSKKILGVEVPKELAVPKKK